MTTDPTSDPSFGPTPDHAVPTIGEVAELVRSKNAGPFWQTLDVFCDDEASFDRIAADGVLTPDRIAEAYRVEPEHVLIFRMSNIRVVKVSFPRRFASGSVRDRDVHAGQQHIPLRDLPIAPSGG